MDRTSKMQTAKKRHAASNEQQSGKNNKKLRLDELPKELLYLVLVCTAAVDECAGPRLTCTCKLFYDLDKDEDYYFELCKACDFVTHFDDGLTFQERFDMFRYVGPYSRAELRCMSENTEIIENLQCGHYVDFNLGKLPRGLRVIGCRAFELCGSLTLTELPEGVQRISDHAFWWCKSLALTKLPNDLTSIGGQAFFHCESLELTELPEGLAYIGDCAFVGCSKLSPTICAQIRTFNPTACD